MDKEIDMNDFTNLVRKAEEEALARNITANTIIIDERLRYVKPFAMMNLTSVTLFPPLIMGKELKFAKLTNNADFILFKSDESEFERMSLEIKKQAVREFADELKSIFCPECDYAGGDIQQVIDKLIKERFGEEE